MAESTAVHTGTPTWQLDPAHSSVEFSVKHMMMTTVRGRFKNIQATLRGDRDHPEAAGPAPRDRRPVRTPRPPRRPPARARWSGPCPMNS